MLALSARADEPVSLRASWSGPVAHFFTGTSLAEDTDLNGRVDAIVNPATFDVTPADIPATAALLGAILYWGGSQSQPGVACATGADSQVTLILPGGDTLDVAADECYCSDGVSATYDIWTCKADITVPVTLAGGGLSSTWAVSGYSGLITDGATDNASAALLLVYSDALLPPQRVILYDGNEIMSSSSTTLSLTGFESDSPPAGTLTYYTLEGDLGGSGTEQVDVTGLPGGLTIILADADNPASNPMNQTINTTTPVQTGTIGVDIDEFDISASLTAGDASINVTYAAGTDTWWLVGQVVTVLQIDPLLSVQSEKLWDHVNDADGDGEVSPGDGVSYTVRLCNTGVEDGTVSVTDTIPPEAASWVLVDNGGGTDVSTPSVLSLTDLTVQAGNCIDILFDVVVDAVSDGSIMSNTATYSAPPEGGSGGFLTATDIVIRVDTDGDSFYDNDDCAPTDSAVYPGAIEACNGIDDNCDDVIDEGCCTIVVAGDVTVNGTITSADIIYLVNYVFKGDSPPQPCEANGDVNCTGSVTSADIIYLVGHVFRGGQAPCDICSQSPIPCL
jgi:hypothetical protein